MGGANYSLFKPLFLWKVKLLGGDTVWYGGSVLFIHTPQLKRGALGAGEHQQLLKQRCAHGPQMYRCARGFLPLCFSLLLAFLSKTPLLSLLEKTEW